MRTLISGLVVVVASVAIYGCKETVELSDPGTATVADDWQVATFEGVDFTFATPNDWLVEKLTPNQLAEKMQILNADVWKSFNDNEASVDLERTVGVIGEPYVEPTLFGGDASQLILVLREETDKDLGIDGAADMWKGTMASGLDHAPITEERVELPVGPAIKLQFTESMGGVSNRVTVYCLVDGPVRYSLFFYETGSGGDDSLPISKIMDSFRVTR